MACSTGVDRYACTRSWGVSRQALRLRVRPEFFALLAGQWPGVDLLSWEDDPGEFEAYCLSYNLPHLFGVERPEDVQAAPYLRAVKPFRPLPGKFRVGIRWAGNPSHTEDLIRSTSLADWATVLDVPGVTFYSLQLGRGAEQRLGVETLVHDLSAELTDWSKTAAALMELDLVITVDTSVAHLAGALGRPVWILLASWPEWRWMLERTDSPWYGSARLFRQRRVGEWPALLAEVAKELHERVALINLSE